MACMTWAACMAWAPSNMRRTSPCFTRAGRSECSHCGAPLLSEARPGVRAADRTLRLLQRAVPPTLGLLGTVAPALPFMDEMMSDTARTLQTLGPRACDLVPFHNWADIMQNGDQVGHILRLDLILSPSSLAGQGGNSPVTPAPLRDAYPAPCQAARDR